MNDANLNTGFPVQMSDDWVNNVANRIRDEAKKYSDPFLKQQKIDIADMLQSPSNRSKLAKHITVVDKSTAQINILKLGRY